MDVAAGVRCVGNTVANGTTVHVERAVFNVYIVCGFRGIHSLGTDRGIVKQVDRAANNTDRRQSVCVGNFCKGCAIYYSSTGACTSIGVLICTAIQVQSTITCLDRTEVITCRGSLQSAGAHNVYGKVRSAEHDAVAVHGNICRRLQRNTGRGVSIPTRYQRLTSINNAIIVIVDSLALCRRGHRTCCMRPGDAAPAAHGAGSRRNVRINGRIIIFDLCSLSDDVLDITGEICSLSDDVLDTVRQVCRAVHDILCSLGFHGEVGQIQRRHHGQDHGHYGQPAKQPFHNSIHSYHSSLIFKLSGSLQDRYGTKLPATVCSCLPPDLAGTGRSLAN